MSDAPALVVVDCCGALPVDRRFTSVAPGWCAACGAELKAVPVPAAATFAKLIDQLDGALGRGDRLEPGDYEGLRERYNRLAQIAEDVVMIYNREHPDG